VKRWGWIWTSGIVLGGAIQFFGPDRTNPPVRTEVDVPDEVRAVLRRACYDCHSNETRWPWYSRVAPVSWFVVGHVNKGRGDLNFSEWPTFDFEEDAEARKDIQKQIRLGKMPLRSYLYLHPDARLSEADRRALLRWAGGL
jgi:hypothetical protein